MYALTCIIQRVSKKEDTILVAVTLTNVKPIFKSFSLVNWKKSSFKKTSQETTWDEDGQAEEGKLLA